MSKSEAAKNRDLAPQVAAFVDSMRAAFGADLKVTYVREGELTIGERETFHVEHS